MKKALIILGPTTTGKTDLGINLAKKINGEIISADSRQVYRDLDIGTGKHPSINSNVKIEKRNGYWKIDDIKIYNLDIADPKKQYSVHNFIEDTKVALKKIEKVKKTPIIVGGTGLYIKALLSGIENLSVVVDNDLRKRLEILNLEDLQKELKKISLNKWESLNESDKKNKRRLFRAIEIQLSGEIQKKETRGILNNFNILKIGLTAPINTLREKIKERVKKRIDQGLIDEGKKLQKNGLTLKRFRELGLDYSLLADYLENKIDRKSLIDQIYLKNGQYAKRQITWFKKEKEVNWFDITNQTFIQKVERLVKLWYD